MGSRLEGASVGGCSDSRSSGIGGGGSRRSSTEVFGVLPAVSDHIQLLVEVEEGGLRQRIEPSQDAFDRLLAVAEDGVALSSLNLAASGDHIFACALSV